VTEQEELHALRNRVAQLEAGLRITRRMIKTFKVTIDLLLGESKPPDPPETANAN
jgi:hypothetical protein